MAEGKPIQKTGWSVEGQIENPVDEKLMMITSCLARGNRNYGSPAQIVQKQISLWDSKPVHGFYTNPLDLMK